MRAVQRRTQTLRTVYAVLLSTEFFEYPEFVSGATSKANLLDMKQEAEWMLEEKSKLIQTLLGKPVSATHRRSLHSEVGVQALACRSIF